MVCHQCGRTVQRGDRFCTGCGIALHDDTATTAADPAPVAEPTGPAPVADPTGPAPAPPVEPTGPDPTAPAPVAGRAAADSASPTGAPRPDLGPAAAGVAPDPALVAEEPTELLPSQGPRTPSAAPVTPAPDPSPPTQPAASPGVPPPEAEAAAERTELVQVVEGEQRWGADDPVWAATGATPVQPAAPGQTATEQPTSDLPTTEPITELGTDPAESPPDPAAVTAAAAATAAVVTEADPTTVTPYDFVDQEAPTAVATEVAPAATAEMPAYAPAAPAPHGFRLGAVTLIALLTGVVALVSLFADVVAVTSSTRLMPTDDTPFGFRTGSWIADDLADNLSIAGLLAIVLMIAGGVAAGFRWRWGAGLAAGAGLAMAGIAGLTLGLAQIPIDAAYEFARIPNEQQFTLTITRDLGYWLMVVAAALGVVLFFAAINDASGDRRSGLNPWIAALGALAAVVAAAGPLIPENQAVFSDNWYVVDAPGEAPALLLVGRLVQLGLLLFAGVVGFLTVRRWGLGLAIGSSVPIIWLATSTLFDLTDRPVGPGFRNPGAEDMHIHGVTIIGVSAVAAMSVLAVIAAYDQAVRERH